MILFLILVTLLLIYGIHLLHQRTQTFRIFKKLGIPGPEPNIIFGNLRELRLSRTQNVLQVMSDWGAKYGPIYGIYGGVRPTLIVQDLTIVKEILIKNSQAFINRPRMVVNAKPLLHTLVGLRDARWKEVRSILTPTFSASKMRRMSPLMCQHVTETIRILDALKEREEFEVLGIYQGLTCDVISECALAMKVNCQKDPGHKFLSAVKGFLANALNPLVYAAICFPVVGYLIGKFMERFAISGQMTEMICENVEKVMEIRRAEMKQNPRDFHDKYVDVLQLMMDASESDKELSDAEIVANAWVFVLGGFETTASALAFTTYLLTLHQDIQERLFQELQSAFAIDEIPSYEQVNSFTYLDQVICESLRLFPPVATFIVREVEVSTQIGPYVIPPNVTIQVPIWQIHHDPENWPEPYKFDPERFHQSNKKSHNSMAYIPFGAGPRSCVGMRFGLLETKLTIARIFRTFKFLPSAHTVENLELSVPTVSIYPKNGIHVRCERRLN